MEYAEKNPAEGMKLKTNGNGRGARKAFTDAQVEHVFGQPVFSIVDSALTGAKRWLPLILLYTGARPEEVAQLRVGDVRQTSVKTGQGIEVGVWVFDFATVDDGQRRKNEASRRLR